MGWSKNYRWLRSLNQQTLPNVDYAKLAATKSEKKLADYLQSHPSVLKIYHALRLNNISGGKSRREVDILVLMKDRIVLVEVKNYSGVIAMNRAGELLQNGGNRKWSFGRLDDAKKRLIDILRETGITLGLSEVHSVLALLGTGTVGDSVTTGSRYAMAKVAKSKKEVYSFLSQPLDKKALFPPQHLIAIKKFLALCGTWDALVCANNVEIEGDILTHETLEEWRAIYRKGRFSNRRGWFGTFFFGPEIIAEMTGWDKQQSVLQISPTMVVEIQTPGVKSCLSYRIDHLASFEFGYKELTDWSTIMLIEPKERVEESSTTTSTSVQNKKREQPYQLGDIIVDVTVEKHLEAGILFRIDRKNRAMYYASKMEPNEWENRNVFYTVGKSMSVKIVKIKPFEKTKWRIEVTLAEP